MPCTTALVSWKRRGIPGPAPGCDTSLGDGLQKILEEAEHSPESVKGQDPASRLIRAIRRFRWSRKGSELLKRRPRPSRTLTCTNLGSPFLKPKMRAGICFKKWQAI